jgi:hypothetical protein
MSLNKQQILDLNDLPMIEVEVPDWHDTVWIKALSLSQWASMNDQKLTDTDKAFLMLAYSIVDSNGKRLFTDKEAKLLGDKASKPVITLTESIKRLNNIDIDTQTAINNKVEELENDSFLDSK